MNTMARGFSIGGVLSTAFNLWTKNLGLYLGISLVFALPAILLRFVSDSQMMNSVGGIVNSIFGMIANGMVTFAIFEHLAGRTPRSASCSPSGWRASGRFSASESSPA